MPTRAGVWRDKRNVKALTQATVASGKRVAGLALDAQNATTRTVQRGKRYPVQVTDFTRRGRMRRAWCGRLCPGSLCRFDGMQ